MRVENTKLVVEPGAGRTGKLAKVVYQFNSRRSQVKRKRKPYNYRLLVTNL